MNEPKPNVSAAPAATELNLLELLLVVVKKWKLVFGVPLLVAVMAALCTLFMSNLYTAKALLVPNDDDGSGMIGAMMAQMGGLASLAGGGLGGTTKADLYITMLRSETVKDAIIDRFHLMEKFEVKYRAQAYKALDERSSMTIGKRDNVITVAVDSKDPKLAAALANAYVDELAKVSAKLKMTGAQKDRAFLEERLSQAKVDLRSAEDKLKSFQTANKAVSVTDQAKATLEEVAQLRGQLVGQEVQLAALRQQLTEESIDVKTSKTTIANLRKQIAKLEGGTSEGALPGVGAMPQLGQDYIRLMRDYKIQETLVELLTKQYEMTKLNEAKDVAPFQVLQAARVPELKSKPKRSLIVFMAGFGTGIIALVLAFIQEFAARMDEEDRSRWQELSRCLPLLGRLRI